VHKKTQFYSGSKTAYLHGDPEDLLTVVRPSRPAVYWQAVGQVTDP